MSAQPSRTSVSALVASPPEASKGLQRIAARITSPLERFAHVESSSSFVLLAAAIIALVWASSPWGDLYDRVWHVPVGIRLGGLAIEQPIHFWINEGLMSVFFFVVGLEIRREMHQGELSTLRSAAAPFFAAAGGMIVPALLFLSVASADVRRGWGVPMATDIAFALGIFGLLGKRVPASVRVFLLAVAIVDDLGALAVIAIFYSGHVDVGGLLLAASGIGLTLVLQRFGARRPFVYLVPATIVWVGALRAGIHPAIAGVILGLLTPTRAWFGVDGFELAAKRALDEAHDAHATGGREENERVAVALEKLELARREALPPSARLERRLHPWVAFGVMPLFALANAGVRFRPSDLAEGWPLAASITLGLVVGKPLGVFGFAWAAHKFGLATVPKTVGWRGLAALATASGIGFTMSIFIAQLAFTEGSALDAAKVGVLAASVVAGTLALVVGRLALRVRAAND